MSASTMVRDVLASDEGDWQRLWEGYNAFYEAHVPREVTEHTWRRILDPQPTTFCRLAVQDDRLVGFSISILHDSTWTATPNCYLEDLFVEPSSRGKGIGRALIEDLVSLAKTNDWARLYWHTRDDNPARKLYDEFIKADRFVRYRMQF